MIWLAVAALGVAVLVAWAAVLTYYALQEASGISPRVRILPVFLGAALVAEVVSKLVLLFLVVGIEGGTHGYHDRPVPPPSPQVSTAVAFARAIVNNQYAAAAPHMDDALKSQLTESRLSAATAALRQQFGNPVGISAVGAKRIQGHDVMYVEYRFQRGIRDVKVVLDDKGKVSGVFFIKHGDFTRIDPEDPKSPRRAPSPIG
jgi:hypothetical protein